MNSRRKVREITYGQIAKLIGRDKNARLVRKVLGMSKYYGASLPRIFMNRKIC